jgi:putative inorganic carbon (hco3(-)) transporter
MRALALIATLLATLPLGFVAPFTSVLIWCWLSFMSPHQLIYLPGLPVVYVAAMITAVGLVISREPKRLPANMAPWAIFLFMIWTTVTTAFALDRDMAWVEWDRNVKTFILALTIMVVMTNRVRFHALVWVIVLSIGYFSLKGGIFTLLSGGGSHVQGITGTVTGDNNNLGLIMLMSWPLINYLRVHSANRAVRLGLVALMGITVVAVLGTYSRGAFLGLVAVLGYFWWKAKRKIIIGALGLIVVLPAVTFMPQQWVDRINTIQTYQSDGSAMGRISQWGFAIRLARDRPLVGGGFDASESPLVHRSYPDELLLAYHSMWFQSLGDHGVIGLLLFISIGAITWRNASVTRQRTRSQPEMAWAYDLATMCQVSLAGYFISGTFLSMAYYDGYYAIVALVAVLRDVVSRPSAAAARAAQWDAVVASAPLSRSLAAETQAPSKRA